MYTLSPEAYVKVERAFQLIKGGDAIDGLRILKELLLQTEADMEDHARSYAASQITTDAEALVSHLEKKGIPLRTTFKTLGGHDAIDSIN